MAMVQHPSVFVFVHSHFQRSTCISLTGFPQALEIMENLENHEKSFMHGKFMEFEKKTE